MNLFNSIVTGNTNAPGPDIAGPGTLNSTGSSLITGNPLLGALGNNGGPTPTMVPLAGSPAIDEGSDTATNQFATDQRGYPRRVGAHVDIGAVEVQVLTSTQPAHLTELTRLGNGAFMFSFTNLTGASFTVFASTNVALPFAQWSNLGAVVESPAGSGQFQFTDPQATNNVHRFYRVRSP